jgi:serine phosphatase RsbU (regulator of sigma subunit)
MVLKNFETEIKLSPSVFLTNLNHMLYGKLAGNFLTAFYGIVDTKNNSLLCATAGHHPPFFVKKDQKEFSNLEIKGKILGLIPDLFYEEKHMTFKPGDRLILFTDGISEHASKDRTKKYDESLLKEAIRSSLHLEPQKTADYLIQESKRFTTQETFEDDVTLLIVDRI